MKLKVANVFASYVVLTTIINEKRELPSAGQYRVARMHDKLESEFKIASAHRDELITKFGTPKDGGFSIEPEDANWKEFAEAWEKIANEEIEVEVQPIPLASLGESSKGVTAYEFKVLGELVAE